MKTFAGIALFATVTLFGVLSSAKVSPLAYGPLAALLPYPKEVVNTPLLVQADLDLYFDLVAAVNTIFDTLVAKLLPLIAALLPIILPLIEGLLACLAVV